MGVSYFWRLLYFKLVDERNYFSHMQMYNLKYPERFVMEVTIHFDRPKKVTNCLSDINIKNIIY